MRWNWSSQTYPSLRFRFHILARWLFFCCTLIHLEPECIANFLLFWHTKRVRAISNISHTSAMHEMNLFSEFWKFMRLGQYIRSLTRFSCAFLFMIRGLVSVKRQFYIVCLETQTSTWWKCHACWCVILIFHWHIRKNSIEAALPQDLWFSDLFSNLLRSPMLKPWRESFFVEILNLTNNFNGFRQKNSDLYVMIWSFTKIIFPVEFIVITCIKAVWILIRIICKLDTTGNRLIDLVGNQ